MKNIGFFDLFPGLSRSNEVFFGKDNALPKTIEKYSIQLKDLITTSSVKDYKNKAWLANVTRILDHMGSDVAKIINAERVVFCLIPNDEINASALNLFVRNDLLIATKDQSGNKTFSLDLDKIADIEDILITTSGYKFRNAKGKILMFNLYMGLFKKLEVDNIVGIILHEMGHQFQDGIYGIYKNIADIYLTNMISYGMTKTVKTLNNVDNIFIKTLCKVPLFNRIFKYIVVLTYNPSLIPQPLRDKFERLAFKLGFKKQLAKTQYKTKDIIAEWDKTGKLPSDGGFNEITSDIMNHSNNGVTGTRDKFIKEKQKEYADEFKKYKEEDPNSEEAKTGNILYNLFKSIATNIKFMQLNTLTVLTLSRYNTNQYHKMSFIKKYEFFADIFATSYGYGPQLWRALATSQLQDLEAVYKMTKIGINRIPLFDAIWKCSLYKRLRYLNYNDEHGSMNDRAKNIYTMLVKELETNTDLNNEQRKAIMADIEALKKADDKYYEDQKISGFWYSIYNKLIDERINGTEFKTEEEILKPIIQVCQESINKEIEKDKKK